MFLCLNNGFQEKRPSGPPRRCTVRGVRRQKRLRRNVQVGWLRVTAAGGVKKALCCPVTQHAPRFLPHTKDNLLYLEVFLFVFIFLNQNDGMMFKLSLDVDISFVYYQRQLQTTSVGLPADLSQTCPLTFLSSLLATHSAHGCFWDPTLCSRGRNTKHPQGLSCASFPDP